MTSMLGFMAWFAAGGYVIGRSKDQHYQYAAIGALIGVAFFFAIYLLIK